MNDLKIFDKIYVKCDSCGKVMKGRKTVESHVDKTDHAKFVEISAMAATYLGYKKK